MAPRAGTADSRRRALIRAALVEIADRGSLDVTMAQIAGRAGVSSALAHHYFGNKEDLILATMRHLLAEFRAEVAGRLRRAEGPRARLNAIIEGSFGPEQFHRATVSAWLTFYAKAQSSAERNACSSSTRCGSTRTSSTRCASSCPPPWPTASPRARAR